MRLAIIVASGALCALGLVISFADGQAIPPPPAAAPVAAAPAAVPAAPEGFNIWKALCPPPGSMEKCKQKLCDSFIGQMAGAMLKPVRLMSGGMMKPCCPTPNMPNPADLKKDATSPAGAAARIKQEEMEAKARRADVRFLGTVDCSRYPEAEKALIKALRTDRNECVRFEAALSLGNGCCCTKATVAALLLTVNGSDKDENPVENSMRVRQAAAYALANCQARVANQPSEPPEKPVPLPPLPDTKPTANLSRGQATSVLPTSFGGVVSPSPTSYSTTGFPLRTPENDTPGNVPTGQRGLLQIIMRRIQTTP